MFSKFFKLFYGVSNKDDEFIKSLEARVATVEKLLLLNSLQNDNKTNFAPKDYIDPEIERVVH